MIEIASSLASAWSASQASQRKRRNNYRQLAASAAEEAEKLRQEYEEKNAYLFRSAAEKTRLAYQQARAQLAARQAKWASQGITGQSASAADFQADVQQAADQQQRQAQTQLQKSAAQNEQEHKTALQKLLEAVAVYRRASQKKSRFGSLGTALRTLLK